MIRQTWRVRFVASLATIGLASASATFASTAFADDFAYNPPGKLEQKEVYGFYGNGYVGTKVFAPGIRFPIETGPAYANSQIYGIGGNGWDGNKPKQSATGWKDKANYAYPWWDNYCEIRSWDMPMCPSGMGHQGQDIRPSDSANDTHWVVAVVDGTITNAYEAATDYLVELTGADGTAYQYLHMNSVQVKDGQKVKKGDRIGKVSNKFYSGGQSVPTSTHLHWQMQRNGVYIPVYTTLIQAYGTLMGVPTGSKYGAKFVSQSWPYSSAPAIELTEGQVEDGYLELENTGTEVWKAGVVYLAPTPRDVVSVFAAPSWKSPTRVSTVTADVKPGETFKFPLPLAGNFVAGEQNQTFGLVAEGVAWFSDDAPLGGGPPDDQLEVKILVKAAPPGSGGSGGTGTAGAGAGGTGGTDAAGGAGGAAGSDNAGGGNAGGASAGGASAGGSSAQGGTSSGGKAGASAGEAGATAAGAGGKTTGKGGKTAVVEAPAEGDDSGCGCRVAGSEGEAPAGLLLGFVGLGLALARRRRPV
jgi:MYXO-CTERM domain-containing protein